MNCPHCEQPLTPEEIKSVWAAYTASLRTTRRGATPVPRRCTKCNKRCRTAREAREHCRQPRATAAA